MKIFLSVVVILLVIQAPLGWHAYQDSQLCDESLAKQLSGNLAKAHPDWDVVDCSFAHFYGAQIKDTFSLD